MSLVRELWFVAPGRVEVRRRQAQVLEPGLVRARALASGISQGTELLLFKGEGPEPFDPSLDAPGSPTYPRRYGYAWVGEVREGAGAFPPGARVFALAPHGDEHLAGPGSFRLLPEQVPPARAVLAANLETAVNVVWDGAVALGDRVIVIGGGMVGLLVGYCARLGGARHVALVEPATQRRDVARRLGFDDVVPPEQAAALGTDADVVIEASGNPACLDLAIARARHEGIVAVASFYGQRSAPVALGSEFHRRRLTLRASQVSHLPPTRAAAWSFTRRFELVCELLQDPRLDALLEPPTPFDAAPSAYDRLARAPGDQLQMVFDYAP
jgi:NADPH:quinone reductase-like Zn-dependent oxidoreductase